MRVALSLFVFIFLSGCGPKYVGPEPLVEDLLAEAKQLYEREKYGEAKEKLEAIKFDHPGNPYIGEVQYFIGMCTFRLKDYPAAEQDFRTVVREFPAGNNTLTQPIITCASPSSSSPCRRAWTRI